MPLEEFKSSQPLTMGVELELQLVSLSDFDLTASSPDLLHLLARKPFPGHVTPEITESMIEINSDVHTKHGELVAQLRETRDTLVRAADTLNIGICGGGTHPFQRWSERKIFSKPRFKEVSALYGYLAKQFTIFGQHVHIGCASGDDALYLLHSLSRYVPHFIALSASSPYVQGNDTLFNSARLNSVFAFPMSGRAPFILKWDEFEHSFFSKMEHTGVIKSMKDFYWDIRPKPEYGTIELRVPLRWPATCRPCAPTSLNARKSRRRRTTTWSTTTTASRLAVSAWMALWCTQRPTKACPCARIS
jgi:carboxylate-amine ligase